MVLLGLFESFVWQIYLMGTYLYLLFSRILTAFIISGVLTKKWVWVLPFPICVLLGPSWTLGQWKICFGDLLIHTHNFYFDRFGHYMILKFFLLTDRPTDKPRYRSSLPELKNLVIASPPSPLLGRCPKLCFFFFLEASVRKAGRLKDTSWIGQSFIWIRWTCKKIRMP